MNSLFRLAGLALTFRIAASGNPRRLAGHLARGSILKHFAAALRRTIR
jgi:hypothetical protein